MTYALRRSELKFWRQNCKSKMADAEKVCLVLKLALPRFTRETQRRKHKRSHKKKERFPFLVLALPLVYTSVFCAYACVVRVNKPLGPIICIDLGVD